MSAPVCQLRQAGILSFAGETRREYKQQALPIALWVRLSWRGILVAQMAEADIIPEQ
jgi:hypothetical protein